MKTAYYADKLETYYEPAIRNGEMKVVRFLDAKTEFAAICKKYGVKKIYAFNATFDRSALNATLSALSNGFCKFFAPFGTQWKCIQRQAVQDLCTRVSYFKFCIEHGFVSEKGNISTSAESIYAYISQNADFVEQHTGLADVLIETEILRKCLRLRNKLHDEPTFSAWREPQAKFKEYVESVKTPTLLQPKLELC